MKITFRVHVHTEDEIRFGNKLGFPVLQASMRFQLQQTSMVIRPLKRLHGRMAGIAI